MRVVLDTVVLVRSLLDPSSWWGRLVFDYGRVCEFIVTPSIVTEYLQVLNRPRLVQKYRSVDGRDLQRVLEIVAKATVVQPLDTPRVCRDPTDDKFLAAAKTSGARYIVTEDADLLDLSIYEEIAIVSAGAFVRLLENGPSQNSQPSRS
jgi:putative PIN family toxin of toxin-antitoxin system